MECEQRLDTQKQQHGENLQVKQNRIDDLEKIINDLRDVHTRTLNQERGQFSENLSIKDAKLMEHERIIANLKNQHHKELEKEKENY